jgi:hypothetical protein
MNASEHVAPRGKAVVDPETFTSVAAIDVAIVIAIKGISNVAINFLIVITGQPDILEICKGIQNKK